MAYDQVTVTNNPTISVQESTVTVTDAGGTADINLDSGVINLNSSGGGASVVIDPSAGTGSFTINGGVALVTYNYNGQNQPVDYTSTVNVGLLKFDVGGKIGSDGAAFDNTVKVSAGYSAFDGGVKGEVSAAINYDANGNPQIELGYDIKIGPLEFKDSIAGTPQQFMLESSGLLGNAARALRDYPAALDAEIEAQINGEQTAVVVRVSDRFTSAQNWRPPRRDPLILDLDGDGIETTGINPNAPILFDHNGDGVKLATGWIRPDDGFLVLDRDGNGTIDSGRELFGDNTILSNGQTASNGFTALSDLDTNQDGKVDSNDARFSELQIWQDLNQDGISQANELSTLAQKGILALNVASTVHSQLLGDGNRLGDYGT